MRKIFVLLLILSLKSNAQETGASYESDIGISPALGYTYIEIDNPDNTSSNYNGFALQIESIIKLYQYDLLTLNLHLLYKNSQAENLSNNSNLSEKASFYGPGAGISFKYDSYGFGLNYNAVKASHSTSGVYSQNSDYSFKTLSYYLDYSKNSEEFSAGVRLTYEAGSISKDETLYSKDVDFSATTAWFYFIYHTGFILF